MSHCGKVRRSPQREGVKQQPGTDEEQAVFDKQYNSNRSRGARSACDPRALARKCWLICFVGTVAVVHMNSLTLLNGNSLIAKDNLESVHVPFAHEVLHAVKHGESGRVLEFLGSVHLLGAAEERGTDDIVANSAEESRVNTVLLRGAKNEGTRRRESTVVEGENENAAALKIAEVQEYSGGVDDAFTFEEPDSNEIAVKKPAAELMTPKYKMDETQLKAFYQRPVNVNCKWRPFIPEPVKLKDLPRQRSNFGANPGYAPFAWGRFGFQKEYTEILREWGWKEHNFPPNRKEVLEGVNVIILRDKPDKKLRKLILPGTMVAMETGSQLKTGFGDLKAITKWDLEEYGRTRGCNTAEEGLFPEAYDMEIEEECRAFFAIDELTAGSSAWVLKGNQHLGSAVSIKTHEEIAHLYKTMYEKDNVTLCSGLDQYPRQIAMRFIKPMLLDNRKFDVRAYVLIASTEPYVVYVYDTLLFTAANVPYEDPLQDAASRVRNVINRDVMAAKRPSGTVDYANNLWCPKTVKHLAKQAGMDDPEFVHNTIFPRIIRNVQFAFDALYGKLKDDTVASGYHLFAFDYLIDDELRPWMIDTNWFPGMKIASMTEWSKKFQAKLMRDMYTTIFDVQLGKGHYEDREFEEGEDPQWHDNERVEPRTGGFVLMWRPNPWETEMQSAVQR